MVFFISLVATVVLKVRNCISKAESSRLRLLYRLDFILFIITVLIVGFYQEEAFITGFETVTFILMLGTFISVIWKMVFNEKNLRYWLTGWAAVSVGYLIAQAMVYSDEGFLKNLVDFGFVEVILLTILAFIGIRAKNIYTLMMLKVLSIVFLTFAILFSAMPPNDFLTIIMSFIGILVLGAIPASVLYFYYKKTFSTIREVNEMVDKI